MIERFIEETGEDFGILANVFKVLEKRNFYEYNELNGKIFH